MFCSLMSVFMYFSGFEAFVPVKGDVILPNSGAAKWWLFVADKPQKQGVLSLPVCRMRL